MKIKKINYTINGVEFVFIAKSDTEVSIIADDDKLFGAIQIPSSITFEGKTYIVTEIDTTAFLSCKGLTNVEIPDTVTKIGIMAFKDCTGLTNITIPNSVVSILYSAFENCTSLTSIELPNNNIKIYDFVFANCKNLKTIVCKSKVPPILVDNNGQVFKGIRKSKVTCIVPKGCKEIYKKDKQWKGFNIVEEE